MTLADSRMVPIGKNLDRTAGVTIQNKYGDYWNSIHKIIMGLHDVRARVGRFDNPWGAPTCELTTMPKLEFIGDKLSDLMDSRAIELSNRAKELNKRIIIQWSGGIDSTSVLVAFIKNLSSQDLDNITVALTTDSILENLNFYLKHINGKIKCMTYTGLDANEEFFSKNTLLNGDPGDCIFGPSVGMYANLISDGKHLMPFKDNIGLIASSIDAVPSVGEFNLQGFGDWYANKISNNLIEVAPEGVETIADWWWWNYFNFKWEFSMARPLFRQKSDKSPISTETFKSLIDDTFFGSEKFQLWSYSNLKNHIGSDISSHKRFVKEYIYEFDKNELYFLHKRKVTSLTTPLWMRSANLNGYFDKDWVLHRHHESGVGEEIIECLESFKG